MIALPFCCFDLLQKLIDTLSYKSFFISKISVFAKSLNERDDNAILYEL